MIDTPLTDAVVRKIVDTRKRGAQFYEEYCDQMRLHARDLERHNTRLREALQKIKSDTVLDKQSADYYKRIIFVWKEWAAADAMLKEGDK